MCRLLILITKEASLKKFTESVYLKSKELFTLILSLERFILTHLKLMKKYDHFMACFK